MMQRILELPEETRRKYDLSSLQGGRRVSGSALPGDLAINWMDEFGDSLYNLYGSTEVAWASIATPGEMRAAPGTAGKAPRGTIVPAAGCEDGWKSEPAKYKHPGDRNPPRGVPVSYLGGSHDNGHRAVSLGNGKIRSTDAGGRGVIATVPLDWPGLGAEVRWLVRHL